MPQTCLPVPVIWEEKGVYPSKPDRLYTVIHEKIPANTETSHAYIFEKILGEWRASYFGSGVMEPDEIYGDFVKRVATSVVSTWPG